MKSDFDVQIVDGHRVLRCHGPIDLASRAEFLYELWGLSIAYDRSIVVDLSRTSSLDSGGVEALRTLGGTLGPGRTLTVVCPEGNVRQALALTDFDQTHLVVETLRSFAPASVTEHGEGAG